MSYPSRKDLGRSQAGTVEMAQEVPPALTGGERLALCLTPGGGSGFLKMVADDSMTRQCHAHDTVTATTDIDSFVGLINIFHFTQTIPAFQYYYR